MALRKYLSLRVGFRLWAAIGMLAGAGTVRAQAPSCQRADVFVGGQDGVTEYRIPVLVTSTKGTLLAFCDARVKKPGDPPNYIRLVLKRSTDGGMTWGPLQTVVDPGEGRGAVADSCGVVDRQTGTIWVFSDYCSEGVGGRNAEPGFKGATVSYKAIKSDDDGQTWSAPIDFTSMVKRPGWRGGSFGPGKGIQTRSGRLVFPRYYTDSTGPSESHSISFVVFSDDHGKSWQIGGETETHGTTNECQVVETTDGSLVLNMRGIIGTHRKIARSQDAGKSWGKVVEDQALLEPRCQASVEYLPGTGDEAKCRMLFSNPASIKRENLTIRLSYDDGRTWPVARQVYAGPAAYSCLSILPDSTAACLYECGRTNAYEKISFARFNVEWLTHGADHIAKNFKIVAFGDSTTAPRSGIEVYSQLLARHFAAEPEPFNFVNRGVGGNTTAMARKRFEKDVLAEKPDLVIVQFGLNDSAVDVWKTPPARRPRVSLEDYTANLRYFIRQIRSSGAAVILMTPNQMRWTPTLIKMYGRPPYHPAEERGLTQQVDAYVGAVRTLADELKIPLVDVYALYDRWEASHKLSCAQLLLDGMHPTTQGQELEAEALQPLISKSAASARAPRA